MRLKISKINFCENFSVLYYNIFLILQYISMYRNLFQVSRNLFNLVSLKFSALWCTYKQTDIQAYRCWSRIYTLYKVCQVFFCLCLHLHIYVYYYIDISIFTVKLLIKLRFIQKDWKLIKKLFLESKQFNQEKGL